MKNIIIRIFVFISIISFYGQLNAQTEHNIHLGDKVKYLGKNDKWQPDNPYSNTDRSFASFGNDLVSVYYKNNKLFFLKYDKKEKKYIETTQIANIQSSGFFGKPLLFEYANMYFVAAYSYTEYGSIALRIYECKDNDFVKWIHLPHYYSYDMPNNSLNCYNAVYSFNGKLYLAYNSYFLYKSDVEFNNTKKSLGKKDIFIDQCIIDNGKFKVDTTYLFKNAISKNRFVIKTMDGFKHRDGNHRFIVSYYVESILDDDENRSNENKGGGVTILDMKTSQHHTLFERDNYICAIDAIQGSIKGKKTFEKNKKQTFRIQVVYNHLEKHTILRWQNKGHFHYRTYTYGNDGYQELYYGKIINHEKALPTSNYKMYLQLVPKYVSDKTRDNNRNNDIIKKEIWLLHPGKHGGLWANIFYSDQFKPDPTTYTYSTDLMDDEKYGSGVRKLWTLIGVTEGAPPVSMDWAQWNLPPRPSGAHPSTLNFSSTSEAETKVTSTFSRSWYNETGVKMGDEEDGTSGSSSYRYTNAYSKSETEDLTNELKISEDYYSSEDTQDTAYLIWQVPSVYRIKYATYPWWDDDLSLSLDSSGAFLFYSLSNTLFFEKVNNRIKPFNIQNSNDSTFFDWKHTNPYRDTIEAVAGNYSIPPRGVSWTSNGPKISNTFVNTTTKTTTTSQKNSFSWTGNINYSIPDVFQVNTTLNFTFAYETDVSLSTSISKAVTVSMKDLENKEIDGAQMTSIYTDAYFFRPIRDEDGNLVDWWYYKYFNGHHPWYVTYVVNSSSKIAVKAPKENGILQEIKDFSWTHDTKDEYKYTVLFCKDDYFGPVNSIEMPVGKNYQLEINDEILNKFPSDSIIYWVVKGKNSKNRYTWSDIHWFVVPKKTAFNSSEAADKLNVLDFLVYPNPVTDNYVNVAFKSDLDNDWVNIEWMSIDGRVVYSKEKLDVITDGCLFKVDIPKLKKGVYFLKISTPTSAGVGKVVINN